jgi:hypothetical protein
VAEGSSSHSVPLLDATALATTTSESAMVVPSFFSDNTGAFSQGYLFTQPVSMRQLITISTCYTSYAAGLSPFSHTL